MGTDGEQQQEQTRRDFADAVNMTAADLQRWLDTPQAKEAGHKSERSTESTGHASGRRIIELLHRKHADLDVGDYAHVRNVVGYVHRHLAQRPSGDTTDSRWRHSLMKWGHDPLKN